MLVSPMVTTNQRSELRLSKCHIESPVVCENTKGSSLIASWSFSPASRELSPSLPTCPTDSLFHHLEVGALVSHGKEQYKGKDSRNDPPRTNSGCSPLAIDTSIMHQRTTPDGILSASKDGSDINSHSLDISFPSHFLEPTPIGPSAIASSSPVRSTSMGGAGFKLLQSAFPVLIADPSTQESEDHQEARVPSPTISSVDASCDQGESTNSTAPSMNERKKRCLHLSGGTEVDLLESPKKRSKHNPPTAKAPTYRPYQEKQWIEQFQELLKFKARNGHCLIQHTCENNSSLSRWVKRQRYQYKLKQENKPSALSDDRVRQLEDIGFVWDSHAVIWEERLAELEQFKQKHGDCNVPSHYAENLKLATWVKCQRRQYRKFCNGENSSMTAERFGKLDNMGFTWKIRGLKSKDASLALDFV